jgi:uncharacterized pyridoxal phosphate-containing UPF0001 family protein|tara:strand:- start:455 stop:715 length:261 start_codon:yes stop_codon:yes gene_type:complete
LIFLFQWWLQCPHLSFRGLMTIGKYGGDATLDFQALVSCREDVATALEVNVEELELSMGMSSDYDLAISLGSSNVRVGSTIFGNRG